MSNMERDIFCKIIDKEVPADIVYEDEHVLAIKDIHPQAPVHILLIPKKHIGEVMQTLPDDAPIVGKIMLAAKEVAKMLNLEYKGFRLIINQGEDGGQIVPHLHVHLLGGKHLGPKIVHA